MRRGIEEEEEKEEVEKEEEEVHSCIEPSLHGVDFF